MTSFSTVSSWTRRRPLAGESPLSCPLVAASVFARTFLESVRLERVRRWPRSGVFRSWFAVTSGGGDCGWFSFTLTLRESSLPDVDGWCSNVCFCGRPLTMRGCNRVECVKIFIIYTCSDSGCSGLSRSTVYVPEECNSNKCDYQFSFTKFMHEISHSLFNKVMKGTK